jgi:ribosome-binding protein aMBF1 (putative translation factor)
MTEVSRLQSNTNNQFPKMNFDRGQMENSNEISQPAAEEPMLSDVSGLSGRGLTAARAFLGWSLHELAKNSGVSFSTIRRIEDLPELSRRKEIALRLVWVLQQAGVEFRPDDNGWFVRKRD